MEKKKELKVMGHSRRVEISSLDLLLRERQIITVLATLVTTMNIG